MNRDIIELRQVVKKLVPMLAGKDMIVTQVGTNAFVEADPITRKPRRVNIPNIPDNAESSFIRAIQGFIDHEIGHVLVTDWQFYGGENLTQRDLRDPKVRRLMSLHNMIEDTMIEREMAKIFPGSRRNISDLRKHFIAKVTKPAVDGAKNAREAFDYLIIVALRALAGHEEFKDYMDKDGHWTNPFIEAMVAGLSKETLERLPTLTTTKETLEVARELEKVLYPPVPPQQSDESGGDESESEPSDGESQDKPDKKAGKGDGDGERDHSESEPGEPGEPDDADGDDKDDAKGKGGKKDDEQSGEDVDDSESGGEGEDDADGDDGDTEGKGDDDSEDTDGDASEDGGEGEDGEDTDGEDTDGEGDDGDGSEDADGDGDGDGGEGEDGEGDVKGASDDDASEGDGQKAAGAGAPEQVVDTGEFEAGDLDNPGGQDNAAGGGIGGGAAKMDFEDDAFEEADLSRQMSALIQREMIEAIKESDYNIYTRDYDRIETPVVGEIKKNWVPELEEQTRQMTGKMQKDIERMLAAQTSVVKTPGYRTGRLHAPNLHRLIGGDDRVFNRKHEHRFKDTAVTLLVDNSGSMSGEKLLTAMIAAYALASTLERVKIACEVIGFTTCEPEMSVREQTRMHQEVQDMRARGIRFHRLWPVYMPIYKGFDERITSDVKKRIAHKARAQTSLGGNIDGESLEYAAIRLLRRREKRKVIMVLSDGHPAGAENADGHLKMMTEKVAAAGIDLVGIGIKDSAVRRFYDKTVVLNNVEELPGMVMTELRAILS